MGGGGDELPLFQKGPPFLQALHSQMCACRFPQTQRPILCSLRDLEGSGVDEATGSWVSPCGWGVWKEKWGRGGAGSASIPHAAWLSSPNPQAPPALSCRSRSGRTLFLGTAAPQRQEPLWRWWTHTLALCARVCWPDEH